MATKSIQARCASSNGVKRQEIIFDYQTGIILNIGECNLPKMDVDYFYDDQFLLFAGMGDIHIHAREDCSGLNSYKEDFHSTCQAALNGGLVHVADMPNNPIPPVDDESYLNKTKLAKNSEIPILMYAGIGPKTKPLSFSVPYKVYMGPSVGELYFKNNSELEEVLKFYKFQNISFHCEDPIILDEHKSGKTHFEKRPLSAELMATEMALLLTEKYDLTTKLCHYSSGQGLELIKNARKKGLRVTCEVTPQHLYFSEEEIREMTFRDQTFFQMNPPIRPLWDKHALLSALKNNEIDYLATDHAPHSHLENENGVSGLPGLDTYAGFVTWLLLEKEIPAETIALMTAENPGKFFNQFNTDHKWGKGFGFLEKDYSASFTILNLSKSHTVTLDSIKSKAQWSPFLNKTFPGSLADVFLAGIKKDKN